MWHLSDRHSKLLMILNRHRNVQLHRLPKNLHLHTDHRQQRSHITELRSLFIPTLPQSYPFFPPKAMTFSFLSPSLCLRAFFGLRLSFYVRNPSPQLFPYCAYFLSTYLLVFSPLQNWVLVKFQLAF